MKTTELTSGLRFGRWTLVEPSPRRGTNTAWTCLCDCGTQRSGVLSYNLTSGKSTSCGCLTVERTVRALTKHQMCGSREYASWSAMKQRCLNPKHPDFHYYGGRGITVCERWMDFNNFYSDMGPRPLQRTLDRKNTNGNYEPNNCRWATDVEQQGNHRPIVVCRRGHPFTPENTAIIVKKDRTQRLCIACREIRNQRMAA